MKEVLVILWVKYYQTVLHDTERVKYYQTVLHDTERSFMKGELM